jgi:hypothetical protein
VHVLSKTHNTSGCPDGDFCVLPSLHTLLLPNAHLVDASRTSTGDLPIGRQLIVGNQDAVLHLRLLFLQVIQH